MVGVVSVFRAVLDGREDAESGTRRLAQLYPDVPFSNGFLHGAAGFLSVAPDDRPDRQHKFREPIRPHML